MITKSEERLRSDSVATPYTLKVAFNRPNFLFSSLNVHKLDVLGLNVKRYTITGIAESLY